jgi:hypothetical protein
MVARCTQTKCAAGDKCGQKNDSVMASTDHLSCGFRMHSPLFCGAHFNAWLAGIGASFVAPIMCYLHTVKQNLLIKPTVSTKLVSSSANAVLNQ